MIRSVSFAEPTWGVFGPEVFTRIVVVSPHFDDAAMGAGHLLGSYVDTTVVTVLAGRPPAYPAKVSEWDALGGFKPGDDVVAVRREEDLAALEVLQSDHRWLEFSDHQYLAPEDRPTPAEVAPVLAATIAELNPTAVFVPMGLGNPDHVMVHEAALLVRQQQGQREWLAKLLRAHPWPTPAIVPHTPDEERKRQAIWCYASQIPPLEQDHALTARVFGRVPEQFWHLAPPPAGWEGLADFI
jgi:LmbE family N-acetylglucosaminyl deacetylase